MAKLDSLKNGQARGGFKPKKVDIGIPSDTPMAEESVKPVALKDVSTIAEDIIVKPAEKKAPVKKTETKPEIKEEKTPKAASKKHTSKSSVDISKYEIGEDTKTKRLNLGIQHDILNYIKFKALRTGTPQYQLVTNIVAEALVNAQKKNFKYNTPELEPYKIKQSSPSHIGLDLPEVLLNDVKEYSRELLMTPTQFYGYALTEARKADVDFEF
ncbi:hypothetical protein [Pseudobutyrivibrio xylanivorans]|uniref:Uncharacterized protein n=1 Tax=Pseudobutyrivibrio xylanivorans TaxID=185007 RepID=A0A5P6VRG1_PSEXY|nr:hypothetical protein [Pseudobutyrivibrio xylanivorans]QFJ53401.1 hypothetical protein FXF36_00195 [Pseudobutyrivibrio xylanivorans]QFJ53478.1 hypothetical protein FXF36_00605 [Pseudobutyrivibrio xylanivorans]